MRAGGPRSRESVRRVGDLLAVDGREGVDRGLQLGFLLRAAPRGREAVFADAVERRAACRLALGETLDEPGVYEMVRGDRDRVLKRRADLESV